MPCSLVCRCRAFTKGLALRPFSKPLKSACVVALLAWPCLSASAVDVNDPRYWLEKMSRSADKVTMKAPLFIVVIRSSSQCVLFMLPMIRVTASA